MGRVSWGGYSYQDEETIMKERHNSSHPEENGIERENTQKHKRKKSIDFSEEFAEIHKQTKKKKNNENDTSSTEVTFALSNHSTQSNNITKRKQQHLPLQKLFTNKNTALYLMKLPNDVDPNDLLGKVISLNGNSKVRLKKKEKLEISLEEKNSNDCQVLAPSLFHIGRIEAVIQGKRHDRLKQDAFDPIVKPIVSEQDVNESHPMFRTNFTEEMAIGESVLEKLENSIKMKKHKKDKGKLQEDNERYKIGELNVENDLGVVKKKKKKTKHEEISENNILTFDADSEGAVKKKKKKKKVKVQENENEKQDSSDDDLDIFAILSQAKQKVLGKS